MLFIAQKPGWETDRIEVCLEAMAGVDTAAEQNNNQTVTKQGAQMSDEDARIGSFNGFRRKLRERV